MKKVTFLGVTVLILIATMAMPSVVLAGDNAQDSHKIANKWDASGTFTAYTGYDWGGLVLAGETWSYKFHIKEAMNGEYSSGVVHFTSGDIDVVGHVKATKSPYQKWNFPQPVLAAAGTAEYDGISYYFMFLYAYRGVWFALSTVPYDAPWAVEDVWNQSDRAYQLHSTLPTETFILDPKEIHE
ncbi:hypothetical protein ACFLTJ_00275 [Chloroflexota bacterium]